jgi:hypothetical protein
MRQLEQWCQIDMLARASALHRQAERLQTGSGSRQCVEQLLSTALAEAGQSELEGTERRGPRMRVELRGAGSGACQCSDRRSINGDVQAIQMRETNVQLHQIVGGSTAVDSKPRNVTSKRRLEHLQEVGSTQMGTASAAALTKGRSGTPTATGSRGSHYMAQTLAERKDDGEAILVAALRNGHE